MKINLILPTLRPDILRKILLKFIHRKPIKLIIIYTVN